MITAILTSTTSDAFISRIKSIFAPQGILEVLMSDNGPHYVSEAFKVFAEEYITALPRIERG
jgi:hypothetical protein